MISEILETLVRIETLVVILVTLVILETLVVMLVTLVILETLAEILETTAKILEVLEIIEIVEILKMTTQVNIKENKKQDAQVPCEGYGAANCHAFRGNPAVDKDD